MTRNCRARWGDRDVELIGVIDELPQTDQQGVRFAFAVGAYSRAAPWCPATHCWGGHPGNDT